MSYSSKWLLVSCLAIGNALLLFTSGLAVVRSLEVRGTFWPLKNHSMLEASSQAASALCYAQFSLLGAFASLGPGRARERWFVVGSVVYLLLLAIPQVFALGISRAFTIDSVTYTTMNSLVVFVLTWVLLAPLSRILGWEFHCEGTNDIPEAGRSFSLLRLLTWTTVIAAILAVLKAVYGNGIWMQIRSGVEAIVSILPILIPICFLSLGTLRWTRACGWVLVWLLLLTGIELLLWFGFYRLLGAPSSVSFTVDRAPMVLVFNGVAVAMLIGNLLALRHGLGLRLQRRSAFPTKEFPAGAMSR